MNKKHTHTETHQHTSPTAPRIEKKRSSTRSRRNTTHQNSTGPTHTLKGVREVHFLGVAHVDGFHFFDQPKLNNALLEWKYFKITIHLRCFIPPKWVIY